MGGRRDRRVTSDDVARQIFVFLVAVAMVLSPLCCLAVTRTAKLVYHKIIEIEGDFNLPSDVAFDGAGRIYVLDGTEDLVKVFSATGEKLFQLGGSSVLNQPLGLDVNRAGDVLVADSGTHRLALFRAGESTPRYYDVPQPPGGKPADPTDVHFSVDGEMLIAVDNDNHRVVALDQNGDVRWQSGTMGRNPEEFRFPFLADVDNQGRIYVVEVINTRVQVLRPDGSFTRFIGEWGIEPGQFYRPKGVAVTDKGEVFVSDSYLGLIQVFDTSGKYLGIVGNEHGNMLRLTTPVGMAASNDLLAVVEMFANRVLVMQRKRQEHHAE
jgi:DNA-binding beta-propeller fold protein YncE